MSKKVQCFIFSYKEKIGKGVLEFFEEKNFKDYLKDGGSLVVRYEEGDRLIAVQTPAPSDKECDEICTELDEWQGRLGELITKQNKSVQDEMRKLVDVLRSSGKMINRLASKRPPGELVETKE